jgi:RNA polymerase primary sigma factor
MRRERIKNASIFTGEHNPVAAYLKDIGGTSKLTSREEKILAVRIRKGDRKALHTLVQANLKFVVAVCRNYENQGLPMADLINEGNLGLIRAANRFDENQDCRFISYAVWWIRQSIMSAMADQTRTVRLSTTTTSAINRIHLAMRGLTQKLGREPTAEEVELETGYNASRVRTCVRLMNKSISLDSIREDEGGSFQDTLADESDSGTTAILEHFQAKRALDQVLMALDRREREVIRLYFGMETDYGADLSSLAKRFGVTKERVRQIKIKALAKLKALMLMMAKYPLRPLALNGGKRATPRG